MADKIIMVDTTILIDYFRKTDKSKTRFVELSMRFEKFCISSVTQFEVYSGATIKQLDFWNELLKNIEIFPFDSKAAHLAVDIQQDLKAIRKSIDKADLFIAATAVSNTITLDTLNRKHFDKIHQLSLLEAKF